MQVTVQQYHRAQDGTPIQCEHHRAEQTKLYRLVQQAATFFTEAEAAAGADLPQFVKEELDPFFNAASWPWLPLPAFGR